MRLIANRQIRQGGRTIEPGEAFDVSSSGLARGLKATRRASDHVEAAPDDREPLRARAAALGIEVDGRWGAARLEEEIAAAEQKKRSGGTQTRQMTATAPEPDADADKGAGRYQRRDMRAEED